MSDRIYNVGDTVWFAVYGVAGESVSIKRGEVVEVVDDQLLRVALLNPSSVMRPEQDIDVSDIVGFSYSKNKF